MNVLNMCNTILLEKIVQSLNGPGTPPSTGETGARTNKIMDEVVKEYYKGKT
jgi:1,5-anhydro-D-fructose reductase (1,5-anhydro-D-mannitol-forming)